jgi:hypothetical protein
MKEPKFSKTVQEVMKQGTTAKLTKAYKKRFIKALQSGRFKKTREILADENGYCCLGVACRLDGVKKSSLIKYGSGDWNGPGDS